MTLDLHGYTLHTAWKMFNQHISGCYYDQQKYVIVVTGYGTIQEELPHWAKLNKHVRDCIQQNPNSGSFKVYLRKHKPRLSVVQPKKNIVDLTPLLKKYSPKP